MKTTSINYRLRAKRVYSNCIKKGLFDEASRLLRSMISNSEYISISYSDIDWKLSEQFGENYYGCKFIKIR